MILWHKHSRRWLSRRIRYIDLVHDVILHHMWLSLCDVMWYQCYKEIDSLLCPILLFISVAFHRKMIRFITSDLHYSDKEWLRKTLLSILISYILHFSPLHTHFTYTLYLTSTTSHVPSFLPPPPTTYFTLYLTTTCTSSPLHPNLILNRSTPITSVPGSLDWTVETALCY